MLQGVVARMKHQECWLTCLVAGAVIAAIIDLVFR